MKIFITASYEDKNEIDNLCAIVKNAGFIDYCFARDEGAFDKPREMMEKAMKMIEECEVLLVEATEKSTGRAIEAGIAFSKNKKIIVIMKEGTQIKDTIRGIADAVISYNNLEEISKPLRGLYLEWTKR